MWRHLRRSQRLLLDDLGGWTGLAVMLHVVLCSFIAVKNGVPGVAVGDVRFVGRFRVIGPVKVLGRLAVMLRSLFMVVGRGGMVLRDVEAGVRRGLWGLGRGHAEVFVALLRFVSMPDRLQGMSMRSQCHVRGMGVVIPDLIVLGGLAVIKRCLPVVICGGCMMFRHRVSFGHLPFDHLSAERT